jgi:hypothetical protein
MRASSDQPESETDWAFATEYYPDLSQIVERLEMISKKLGAEYRAKLLSSRDFSSRRELAKSVEDQFFSQHFGSNEKIVDFARELILGGHDTAADELSRAAKLFGDNADANAIVGHIRCKFFLVQTVCGEVCSEESRRILHSAVEKGHSMRIDERNTIILIRGTSEMYLRTNADIYRLGRIIESR